MTDKYTPSNPLHAQPSRLTRRSVLLAGGAAAALGATAIARAEDPITVVTTWTIGDSPWGRRLRLVHTVTSPNTLENATVDMVVVDSNGAVVGRNRQTGVLLWQRNATKCYHDVYPTRDGVYTVRLTVLSASGTQLANFTNLANIEWPSGRAVGGPTPTPTPTVVPTPTPTPTPTVDPTQPSDGFQLGDRPFAASSSWNTPLTAAQLGSLTAINWPQQSDWEYGGRWPGYWVNWADDSDGQFTPMVMVTTDADPERTITVRWGADANWGWPTDPVTVRLPDDAEPATGTDGELVIIDRGTVWTFYQFRRNGNDISTGCYGKTDVINGSGWGWSNPIRGAGTTAAGSSEFAGLLVEEEMKRGPLRHALALSMIEQYIPPGPYGEAVEDDGKGNGNARVNIQQGRRLAIPANAQLSGLSHYGQMVFQALKEYGAFLIDTTGAVAGFRAQLNGFTKAEIDAMRDDAARIIPLLRQVNP